VFEETTVTRLISGILGVAILTGIPLPAALCETITDPIPGQDGADPYAGVVRELRAAVPALMDDHDIPGLAIALVAGDETVWAQGFGHTTRDRKHQVTADTPFSIQSASKALTATGFLIAVSKGLVQLDEPLRLRYPEFTVNSRFGDDEVEKITYRRLLSHWAGLCHEAPVGNNLDDRDCTFEEHVYSISDTWLKNPVGKRFSYSNLGYDLTGYVLQRISNKTFMEYMRDELLDPLDMNNSTYDQRHVMDNAVYARGHTGEHEAPAQFIPMIPAGGVFASVADIAKFVSFRLAGGMAGGRRLIEESLFREMTTPQFAVEGQVAGYGLGVFSILRFGSTCFEHGGGGYGYRTAMKWMPEYGVGVVVLCNQDTDACEEIANTALKQMIEVAHGAVPDDRPLVFTDRPVIRPDADSLRRLEGTYRIMGNAIMVQEREGTLYLLGQVPLDAHGDSEFTWPGRARITFDLDRNGRPRGMQYMGRMAQFYVNLYCPLERTPSDDAGPAKSVWAAYKGVYSRLEYGNVNYAGITVRNGYLTRVRQDDRVGTRLHEYGPGLFFDAEGEAVIFEENGMSYGNMPMSRETDPFGRTSLLVEAEPDHPRLRAESLESLGSTYLALDEADRALAVFTLNTRLHPRSVSALEQLADVHFEQGNRIQAEECCERILELEPDNRHAAELLDAIRVN